MQKSLSLLFVVLLSLGGLAALPTAAAAGPTGTCSSGPLPPCAGVIEFLGQDRQTPTTNADGDAVPDISGTGAVAVVHLFDSDLATSTSVAVSVHRAGITTGAETITLTADPVNSGHFYGQFGVETTDVANNGRVLVVDNEKLAVDYVDASPAATIQSAANTLEWLAKTTGSVAFTAVAGSAATFYGSPGLSIVTITDADQNVNTGAAETLSVRLTTVRDQVGIQVDAIETGVNTGVFQTDGTRGSPASLKFGASSVDGTNTLAAQDGDVITATYIDALDALGHTNSYRTATAAWRQAATGFVSFTDATYRINATNYRGESTTPNAFVRVEDADQAGAGTTTVVVKSDADLVGTTITLTETGANTGEFTGSFAFIFNNPTVPSQRLQVTNGNTVTATYTDARDGAGASSVAIADTVTWNIARTGVLRYALNDQYDTNVAPALTINSTLYFDGAKAFVDLVDADLVGLGTFPVRATSTRDPIGLNVTLKELGTSGIFRGCFEFNNDTGLGGSKSQAIDVGCDDGVAPGNLSDNLGSDFAVPGGRLLARNGDVITVTYIDANTATGGINVATTQTLNGAGGTAPPSAAGAGLIGGKGTITFKACTADCTTGSPTLVDASTAGLFGTGVNTYGWVEILDANWNLNLTGAAQTAGSNPGSEIINEFTVSLSSLSGSFPATPGSRTFWNGTGNLTEGTGIHITVTETTSSSALFRGKFGFTTGASNDTTDHLQVASLTNPFSDTVTASYSYAGTTLAGHTNNTVTDGVGKDKVGLGVVAQTTSWKASSTALLNVVSLQRQGAAVPRLAGLGTAYLQLTTGVDSSEDSTVALNTAVVRVKSTADSTGILVTLTERYSHAGEHSTGTFHQTSDNAFLGSLRFSTTSSSDATDVLKVNPVGDTVFIEFDDVHNATGLAEVRQIQLPWVPATLGTMTLLDGAVASNVIRGDGNNMLTVQVTDSEANANLTALDTVQVLIVGDRDAPASAERFMLNLTETGVNTGIFNGTLIAETSAGNSTRIHVVDGSAVTVTYFDPLDANGVRGSTGTSLRYFSDSHGGLLQLNKAAYVGSETATLTLWDPDADTTGSADTVKVRVYSESDGVGELITLTETGSATDNFTGTFGFETSRVVGNSLIAMSNGDQFAAYYVDCPASGAFSNCTILSPTAARLARSSWTLTGVFNAPTAGISANVTTGVAPAAIRFTLAASDSDGTISSYTLNFGDGSPIVSGGNPNAATQDHTYAIAGTYTATLTVTDNAALTGTASMNITVTSPDVTAPSAITNLTVVPPTLANAVTLNWSAPGDDAAVGTVSAYNITVSTFEITASNIDTVARVAGVAFNFTPVTLGTAGVRQTVVVSGLNASTVYFFAVRGIDDGANKGAISNVVNALTATPDLTGPTGTLAITSSTHAVGVATEANDPTFSWNALTDAESTIVYRYVLNQLTGYTLNATDLTTASTNVTFTNIAAGTWYFHLRGESAGGNSAQAKYTILITDPAAPDPVLTASQIEIANKEITLVVTRADGENTLRWTLPAETPAPVRGIQIWRSNSPYSLLATYNVGSSVFNAGSYTDSSTGAKATSAYLVTMFYGTTSALGFFTAGTAPDTADYPGVAFSSGSDGNGLSNTAWMLIGVGVLVFLILLVVLIVVLAKRGKKDDSGKDDDVAWDSPAAAPAAAAAAPSETHHLRCPACQTSFTATGAKPITTACPGCGRRGVLR